MAYRTPGEPASDAPRVVSYGRFRPPALEVMLVLVFLVLGAGVFVAVPAGAESLRCQRSAGSFECVHGRGRLFGGERVTRFSQQDVSAVEWVPYLGDKRSERGRTEVFDRTGRPMVLFRDDREDAEAAYRRIQAFVEDDTQQRLLIESDPAWGLLLLGVLFLGFGLVPLVQIVRTPTSVDVVIHGRARRLDVRQRWLGVVLSRRDLSLDDVRKVEVERGLIRRLSHRRGYPGDPAARVVLRYDGGASQPLVERFLPDPAVHERMADIIRVEVGQEPESPSHVGTQSLSSAPIAQAPKPPTTAGRYGWKKQLKWTLTGLAFVAGLGFGAQWLLTRGQGRLTIHCDHRCRFQGLDCRPGGVVSDSHEPGDYVVEVFDADAPGGWRPVEVTVRQGETTHFHCR